MTAALGFLFFLIWLRVVLLGYYAKRRGDPYTVALCALIAAAMPPIVLLVWSNAR